MRRIVYSRADAVTALNGAAADWLSGACKTKAMVVPLALRPLPEPLERREPVVLGVGRLHRVKGFDLLIRAFARVSPAFPAWRLRLIGKGPEGGALRKLCEALDVSDRVDFQEPVRDIHVQMARAGLVVLPSRSEAFGNVVLESMAMASPVIATNCAGPAGLIEHGVNGYLVPVDDVHALADTMVNLLSDSEKRRNLGNAAYSVRRRFQQAAVMRQWEACLFAEIGSDHAAGVGSFG